MAKTYEEIFKNLLGLSTEEMRALESIRFRDQDQSTKGGALLAFSGLLIATSLVQFSADESTVVFLSSESPLIFTALSGLLLLFVSSFFSLSSLVAGKNYSSNPRSALMEFFHLVQHRRRMITISYYLCLLGTIFTLITLFAKIVPNLAL